jgi:hypothetical protein
MPLSLLVWLLCFAQLPAKTEAVPSETKPLEKSSYFAFVDRELIFTVEVVKPGEVLLNFVSMSDRDYKLQAKNVRLMLENRKTTGNLFKIETGDPKEPAPLFFLTIHSRSSFGVQMTGDFENVTEFSGVTIRIENEDFKLVPLTNFEFEELVLKVDRINLGSPDFSDDWRIIQLKMLGNRVPARR